MFAAREELVNGLGGHLYESIGGHDIARGAFTAEISPFLAFAAIGEYADAHNAPIGVLPQLQFAAMLFAED